MFDHNLIRGTKGKLLVGILAGGSLVSPAPAQSPAPAAKSAAPVAPSRYQPNRFAGRAGEYYRLIWGVDSLAVKWT